MKAFNMNWTHTMEGGRLIDASRPWMRFSGDAVWRDENGDTTLHILTSPKDVRHWDGKTYSTKYAVGLMRSEQPFRPDGNFVRYEVEWLPDRITFYANGLRTRTVGEDIAKHLAYKRAHVIFNLWTDREDFTVGAPMIIRNFRHK